jgi:hypothetical protein
MKLTGDLVKVYTAKEDTSVDHVNATGTPSSDRMSSRSMTTETL